MYSNKKVEENTDNPEIKNLQQLDKLIKENDIIVIDSFVKLKELDNKLEVDTYLRKKYNGKLFLIVFQQTTEGKMRGGLKVVLTAIVYFLLKRMRILKSTMFIWVKTVIKQSH